MEVQKALEQLAQAIKDSDIYREYRRQSEKVDNTGDMREKIDLTSWMLLRENMRNSGKTRWWKNSWMPNWLSAV